MKHINCHVMSEKNRTIRFILEHRRELIDSINAVCAVAQTLLNSGMQIVYADIYKTGNGEFMWALSFDHGNETLTKYGNLPSHAFTNFTHVWELVMESQSGPDWNDHYYSDPLPYDSSEINMAIELVEMWAED